MKNNNFSYLLILASLQLLLGYFSSDLLRIKELYSITLSESFTQDQIIKLLNFQDKWQWVGYLISPVLLLLKLFIISAVLDIGIFFFNKEIKYSKLFTVVVKAEYVFLLVIVAKTLLLYFVAKDYTFEEVQNFYPFSMLHLFGTEGIDRWYYYPLQVLNLFELAYWIILANLLGKALSIKIDKAFEIVVSSYGVGFIIWVIGVMFLVLNMS